ncbi:MAG: hypothetical protein PHQ89_02560 [Bacilli bacterium]|nr:hypothetical protein [Bacilli bacterium]
MKLYGDNGNIKYLEQSSSKIKIIYTNLNDKPAFLTNKIDMIYLGPCTEDQQIEIIDKLMPYKDKIKDLIEKNTIILATGNALEIFGNYIEDINGNQIKALGIFDIYAKRIAKLRYNELFLGVTTNGYEIVGFKNQMSHLYGKDKKYFQDAFLGTGRNTDDKEEGINYKNFIGTYILGPIFPLNPHFSKYILKLLGVENIALPFEEDAIRAYDFRLNEFKKLIK